MKKTLKHLLSMLACIGFLVLAVRSVPPSSVTKCGDPRNVPLDLMDDRSQSSSVLIRVVDKETNEPIPTVLVDITWLLYIMVVVDPQDCPDEGSMTAQGIDFFSSVTDANGMVVTPVVWVSRDIKDRLVGVVSISDPVDKYIDRQTNIRIDQDVSSSSFTISLLKYETL